MTYHLSRPVLIHICRDRTFTFRTLDEPVFNGVAIPVFSVDTKEEAQDLQIRFCKNQYGEHPQLPGQRWYKFFPPNDYSAKQYLEYDDLEAITKILKDEYKRQTGK